MTLAMIFQDLAQQQNGIKRKILWYESDGLRTRTRTEGMERLRKTPLNLNNCQGFGPSLWSSGRLFYMERKTVHLRPLIAMSTLAKLRPLFKIRKQQTCFRRESQAKAASTPQGFFWLHSACPSISCWDQQNMKRCEARRARGLTICSLLSFYLLLKISLSAARIEFPEAKSSVSFRIPKNTENSCLQGLFLLIFKHCIMSGSLLWIFAAASFKVGWETKDRTLDEREWMTKAHVGEGYSLVWLLMYFAQVHMWFAVITVHYVFNGHRMGLIALHTQAGTRQQ